MVDAYTPTRRKTAADDVFEELHDRIVTLDLLPGDQLSETEIAKRFDVSRQPVREAFIRLANLNLLEVRPQRSTRVRRFSSEKIARSRFVRMAVEKEVLRRACEISTPEQHRKLQHQIELQQEAIDQGDQRKFHLLDYDFHYELCASADCSSIFQVIADSKQAVDRICVLSLQDGATMQELIGDHRRIVDGLTAHDEAEVMDAITLHLSRLDEVIEGIRKSHADFFED